MKYAIMYSTMAFLVWCADDVKDHLDIHTFSERFVRTLFWPLTLISWFRSQNGRMHRFLNILWIVLISGWLLSLMADRL